LIRLRCDFFEFFCLLVREELTVGRHGKQKLCVRSFRRIGQEFPALGADNKAAALRAFRKTCLAQVELCPGSPVMKQPPLTAWEKPISLAVAKPEPVCNGPRPAARVSPLMPQLPEGEAARTGHPAFLPWPKRSRILRAYPAKQRHGLRYLFHRHGVGRVAHTNPCRKVVLHWPTETRPGLRPPARGAIWAVVARTLLAVSYRGTANPAANVASTIAAAKPRASR